jgi:hypothetical protein
MAAELSQAGSLLGTFGAISRAESRNLLKQFDEIDNQLVSAEKTLFSEARKKLEEKFQSPLGKVDAVLNNINKMRVGLMTIQLATTVRNTTNGYMRNAVYALDNLGAGFFNKYIKSTQLKAKRLASGAFDVTDEEIAEEAQRAARIGAAQMKAGWDGVWFKDLMFMLDTADTATLARLMENPLLRNNKENQTLFMSMGDVARELGEDNSKAIKFARFLNSLNTASDNMFKRAIFAREVDAGLRAGLRQRKRIAGTNTEFVSAKDFDEFKKLNPKYKDFEYDELEDITRDSVAYRIKQKDLTESDELALKNEGVAIYEFSNKKEFDEFKLQKPEYQNLKFEDLQKEELGLSHFLKTGRFSDIPDNIVAKAMEKALDFTYQTSKFKGKEGWFNSFADTFITFGQSKFGSTIFPFPRYLINQFRFAYEHTPILGSFDFAGILNKSDAADRFGKQMSGFAILGALYGIRSHYGDETTGPFDYYNPFGRGRVNAEAALGPFSTYAFAADAFYKYRNPKASFSDVQIRDAIKSLGGGQFRPTGLNAVDGLFDIVANLQEEGGDYERQQVEFQKRVGGYFSNILNTFTVGAGMYKDLIATIDPEMRFRRDNEDVNFWDEFFKQATRSLPASDEGIYGTNLLGRPKAESPTRTTGIKMVNPFMRQLTGLTPIEERTVVERELDKLGFEYIQIVPKKIFNDPDLNREMKRRMGELVETKLNSFILTNDLYNKLDSRIEKKKLLKEQLGKIRSQAKEDILDPNRFETPELQNRVARAKFNNFSSDVRNLVAKYYRDRFGKEIGNDYIGALYIKENHPMTN